MELTININVSERFCDAVELLAVALTRKVDRPEMPESSERVRNFEKV